MEFSTDRNLISEKLEIGKEMLYLSKEEVMEIGISKEDVS